MSEGFIFQVEAFAPFGQATIQIEGRCCEGSIQVGDTFSELLVRTRNDDGSFNVEEARSVSISVREVTSIRPGLLGVGEAGTLEVGGADGVELGIDSLLKGHRTG